MSAKQRDPSLDEDFTDISVEEIQEFLDADGIDVMADPAFEEKLRATLLDLVQSKARSIDAPGRNL